MATVPLAATDDDYSTSPPTPSMFAAPDPDVNQSSADRMETMSPIVSFGLITDIQYANHDDRWNYIKTALRRYRNALTLVREACEYWSKQRHAISFILQLGDLIDGVSAENNASQADLDAILDGFRATFPSLPIYHVWGNHELYNFTRAQLLRGPLASFDTKGIAPGHYGTFEVCPRLRIIALDTYEFSALGVEKTDNVYIQSVELLSKHNQNQDLNDPRGLRGHQRRFVKFNGGITPTQFTWLHEQLTSAKAHNEKVMIIGEAQKFARTPPVTNTLFRFQVTYRFIRVRAILSIFCGTTRKCSICCGYSMAPCSPMSPVMIMPVVIFAIGKISII